MGAASIGIETVAEADVGAVVFGDDRLRFVGQVLGLDLAVGGKVFVVRGKPGEVILDTAFFEPVRRIDVRAATRAHRPVGRRRSRSRVVLAFVHGRARATIVSVRKYRWDAAGDKPRDSGIRPVFSGPSVPAWPAVTMFWSEVPGVAIVWEKARCEGFYWLWASCSLHPARLQRRLLSWNWHGTARQECRSSFRPMAPTQ